jgi:nucleoside-diphosphate kinase
MNSGPVIAMVWQGSDIVANSRRMIRNFKPLESEPGSMRGDFCIDVCKNVIHGSDSIESAKREIALWFKPDEIQPYSKFNESSVYE